MSFYDQDDLCNLEEPNDNCSFVNTDNSLSYNNINVSNSKLDEKDMFNSISKEFKKQVGSKEKYKSKKYLKEQMSLSKSNNQINTNSSIKTTSKNDFKDYKININNTESDFYKSKSKNTSKKDNKLISSTFSKDSLNEITEGSSLYEIIHALREKLVVYEVEMRSIIDEKISLQMQLNNLQIQYCQISSSSRKKKDREKSKEKSVNHLVTSVESNKSNKSESALEVSKYYIQEASGLKSELANFSKQLERQKELIKLDESLLNESIEDYTYYATNKNSKPICSEFESNSDKRISNISATNPNKNSNCNHICNQCNNSNINDSNNITRNEVDVKELKKEKELMMEEINNLKNEIYSLMEMQKQLLDGENNEENENEEKEEKAEKEEKLEKQLCIQESNTESNKLISDQNQPENCKKENNNDIIKEDNQIKRENSQEINIDLNKKKEELTKPEKQEIDDSSDNENNEANMSNLPPIDYFFKLNGKIILVDTDKNLWHLKKCREYDEYKKKWGNSYQTKDELFDAFIEYYQNMELENQDNENIANNENFLGEINNQDNQIHSNINTEANHNEHIIGNINNNEEINQISNIINTDNHIMQSNSININDNLIIPDNNSCNLEFNDERNDQIDNNIVNEPKYPKKIPSNKSNNYLLDDDMFLIEDDSMLKEFRDEEKHNDLEEVKVVKKSTKRNNYVNNNTNNFLNENNNLNIDENRVNNDSLLDISNSEEI